MLEAAGSNSPIHAAMKANATVNMANRMTEDMSSLVTVEYSKAISKVKAALADRELFLKDEVLAAVWLMSKREMFVGLKGSALYAYDTHYSGMLTLLQMRGPRQLETERGRQLFQLFLAPLNWGPLLTRQAPSQQYLELEALMIKTSPCFPDTLLQIHRYYHDVCTSLTRPTRSAEIKRLEGNFSRLNEFPLVAAQPVSDRPSFSDDQALCLWYFRGWISFFYWSKLHVARMYLHLSQIQLPASRNIFHQSLRSFLGSFSYALGDVDDHGRSRPEATAATRNGRLKESRGINVLGALHVQAPLRHLTADPNLYPHESRGVSAALSRLNAEFRLW
ncbi:hypothetical protein LTR05_008295 [Lithohypha guttulata]|uniref:Uncharacterized protein n=1 Tax=Lithohypha guttulata TaxID=1690604 RepID=A0AAN7SU53_9EURO|nr:hypothetical protein LTR05_008295 [Lithohypha guttulata]